MSNAYTSKIIVNSPKSKVFGITLDMDNFHKWSGSIDSGYISNKKFIAGTKFFEVFRLRGKEQKAEGVITEFNPEDSWSYSLSLAGYEVKGKFIFEDINTDQTRVIATAELIVHNLLKMSLFFRLFSEFFFKKQLDTNLKDLKNLIETDGS